MATFRKLFVLVLTSCFLLKNISVNGFNEPSPRNASIDMTKEIQNSSMLVEKLGDDLPANVTWSMDSGELGYPCGSRICLSLCCPPEKTWLDGRCIAENNTTSWNFPRIRTSVDNNNIGENIPELNFHLFINDPCSIASMASSVLRDFDVLPNGSIYARSFDQSPVFDFKHHCLFREPQSDRYSARVCRPWIIKVWWQIICLIFCTILMFVIIIVYSVVPELRNLHGMVFRSYIAAYIGCHLSVMGQQLTADSRASAFLFTFFVFSLHYCAGCCSLWLNVMSFNLWRSFRGLRSIDSNSRERERKKFIFYAIYACVTPAVLNITTATIMSFVPYFRNLAFNESLILWSCATLLTSVIICNTILYSLTALRIMQHQKDTKHLSEGVNKHHEAEKQWFNLHVKLFMVTGVHTIMWVIWELWPVAVNTSIMVLLEVIQTVLIFIIFIWKDNVKRSLRKRLDDTLCQLQSPFISKQTTPLPTRS